MSALPSGARRESAMRMLPLRFGSHRGMDWLEGWMVWARRLGLYQTFVFFSTTFLSFFRTTTPQISQKFREGSLSVYNTHTQSVSGSTLTIPPPNPHASALLRSIPSLARVAHLTCDLGSLSQSCGCCSAPVRTGGRLGDRGLFTGRPGPATFAKFRPFATPLRLSEKLSRKSGTGQGTGVGRVFNHNHNRPCSPCSPVYVFSGYSTACP